METLIYIFDLCAVVVVLFYSYKNDRRKASEEEIGPFRIMTQKAKEKD